ncbi:MAG: hypothetical protein M1834_002841 [Cirrosporium novae-zelandiae]|nr:MAG: hypothetical protein M1834_002841 [Cirrosporium novae-zelandiae]
MNHYEEDEISLGGWRDDGLFPSERMDERASSHSNGVKISGPYQSILRTIQNESLDRNLRRHHITGIAISGTIGIGLFINSGEFLGLSGSVGIILAYLFAGLIVMAVMLCLSEMVSVRPVPGAIFEYPKLYVDPALGYAVGFIYWFVDIYTVLLLHERISESLLKYKTIYRLAYSMSLATLTVSAAILTKYWDFPIEIGWFILILIIGIASSNIFGVRLYGNIEWACKWMKILLIAGLDIVMIAINVGISPKWEYIGGKYFAREYQFPPGFSSEHLNTTSSPVEIEGSRGVFLGVWSSITLIGYAFIGVELVVVTAGEAKYPRRDLPKASRRIYIFTMLLYLISAILIAFNVPFTHSGLISLSESNSRAFTGKASPFIMAIEDAEIPFLASFVNTCFLLAAWTAANTALYVSSRTLYALARSSDVRWFKASVGRTSLDGTPLSAIALSFLFAFISFFGAGNGNVRKVVNVCNRISTICILCVYVAECISFLRFMKGMEHSRTIDRTSPEYRKNFFRSPRQPFPAYFGIISCTSLILFNGWETFFQISKGNINGGDAATGLISAYLGPILFLGFYVGYKFGKGTRMTSYANFGASYIPMEEGLDEKEGESRNRVVRFLSWVR